jgi:mono/diheme cytochrome c family protein
MPAVTRSLHLAIVAAASLTLAACRVEPDGGDAAPADLAARPFVNASDSIAAGRYLVIIGGCNDCHTPGYMENGASVPESAWLTGTPIGFRGPWGTSYPRNLRLTASQMDANTWVHTLHTRTALPPMPWVNVNSMSERDLRAIYYYIRSLTPLGEPTPLPVPPGQEPATPYFDFVPQHMERLGGAPAPPPAPADTARVDTSAATPAAPAPATD